MARPRTLGPTITFRLPIEQHEKAVALAESHGETVDNYLRRRFSEALDRTSPPSPDRGKPKDPVEPRWKASMKS